MKGRRNNRHFLPLLMISSQLLLTAFVLYWLMGQYREERTLLKEQLRTEYIQVQEQLVDSMLLQHLVMPVLDDSVKIIVHSQQLSGEGIWIEDDTTVLRMRHPMGELPEEISPEEIKIRAFSMDPLVTTDSLTRKIDFTSIITEEERMVRSVKLFINNNPATFQSDTGMQIFAMHLDSNSLARNMATVLEARGWPFSLDWPVTDLDHQELTDRRVIKISGGPHDRHEPMQVANYKAYLIRGILPQILFALVLLLLSASALLFSYRSMNRQRILNRLRDDFIANISHELKTPVSTVKIALEALQNYNMQKDPKVADEYLDMAGKEMKRLESLVGKVLDHQVLDNSSLQLELESCDLCELTRKVVHTLEIPIRERGAKIFIEEEDDSCRVQADKVYVEGMIMNLIDNSLKYTGEHPVISIRIASTATSIELSVRDQGPGIPDEFKDQIFEKFFRIPQGDKHDVKGYGLGLNFAAQVMARHGGKISHSNLPEGGCRFTLQFPRSQA